MNPIRIAFASCAFATRRPKQPAWTEIRAADPDLLLLLGDQAYMSWDGGGWLHDDLEKCYQAQFKVEDFVWLTRHKKVLAIWDDHDCGPNNVCGAEWPAEVARSRELFEHHMKFALNAGRPEMYMAYDEIPGLRILMLDGRTHRTKPTAAQPTVLGGPQEQWLWDQLDPAKAPQRRLTIVCSGVGLTQGAKLEKLDAYKDFSRRLRQELAFRPGGGDDMGRRALLLAGDIHRNAWKPQKKERFYEALSSGVACFKPLTWYEHQFVEENHADNWGLITIEPEQVRFDFHGRGDNAFSRRVRVSDWREVPQ